MLESLIMVLMFLSATFLILLVLVQRGRGGGLAGAFGGLGGQSAFGTKAGDLFTRVTIGVAAFWIILCAASVKLLSEGSRSALAPNLGKPASSAPEAAGGTSKSGAQPGATGAPAKSEGAGESKAAAPASDNPAAPAGDKPAAAPASAPAAAPASTPAPSTPAESK